MDTQNILDILRDETLAETAALKLEKVCGPFFTAMAIIGSVMRVELEKVCGPFFIAMAIIGSVMRFLVDQSLLT